MRDGGIRPGAALKPYALVTPATVARWPRHPDVNVTTAARQGGRCVVAIARGRAIASTGCSRRSPTGRRPDR
jgi:hypothetical protein